MVSTSEMQDKLSLRFAFDRDLVRRHGYRAFRGNGGILELCSECDEDFDRKAPNQMRCNNCRTEHGDTKSQTRERVRRFRERNKYQTQNQQTIAQEQVTTPDPYTNLMLPLPV